MGVIELDIHAFWQPVVKRNWRKQSQQAALAWFSENTKAQLCHRFCKAIRNDLSVWHVRYKVAYAIHSDQSKGRGRMALHRSRLTVSQHPYRCTKGQCNEIRIAQVGRTKWGVVSASNKVLHTESFALCPFCKSSPSNE
eukprot:1997876-Amphidinium_carterae.1